MKESLKTLKSALVKAVNLSEEVKLNWKFDQAWTSDDICPNCNATVKPSRVKGGGVSTIVCTGCGKKGLTKIESGTQLINWKIDPH